MDPHRPAASRRLVDQQVRSGRGHPSSHAAGLSRRPLRASSGDYEATDADRFGRHDVSSNINSVLLNYGGPRAAGVPYGSAHGRETFANGMTAVDRQVP